MTEDEALVWLNQVKGRLYKSNRRDDGAQAWVALVRTPRAGRQNGKLIVALGASMTEATNAAADQWQSQWERFGQSH